MHYLPQMPEPSDFHMPTEETSDRESITARQHGVLGDMLAELYEKNAFYRTKWRSAGWQQAPVVDDFARLPLTSKQELVADAEANPPYGTNLTYPLERYVRLHQTSGTSGHPLVVLDTAESWQSWKQGWGMILRAAGVRPGDAVYAAFSFGPFVGFWSGFEAAQQIGCRVLTGGGQSSAQRLEAIERHQARVLLSTPSYALYLAEVAREQGLDPAASPLEISIHAGEPGASIPATKARIEADWGVRCFDHIGASEVGPFAFECRGGRVHVNEWDYVSETLEGDGGAERASAEGDGELLMTNLNRRGFPVVRYRTGDLVRLRREGACDCGRSFAHLEGGVIGRADDMMTIRGVNVFPSAIEAVLRESAEVVEFQGSVTSRRGLDELALAVELAPEAQARGDEIRSRLEDALRRRLGLRVPVGLQPPGSLPRYELKAKRFRRES